MKHIEITCKFWSESTTSKGLLLETLDDVAAFNELGYDEIFSTYKAAIKSKLALDRWDHLSGYLGTGYVKANISGGSPLIEAGVILDRVCSAIADRITSGTTVFVNSQGGWMPITENVKIIDVFTPENTSTFFSDNPSLLILENDPIIEDHAKDYFKTNKLEVSYICKLRTFNRSQLLEFFNKFDGYGVYVYTTGSDVEQVREYLSVLAESKLDTAVIEFNSEVDDEIYEIIKFAKTQLTIEVTY